VVNIDLNVWYFWSGTIKEQLLVIVYCLNLEVTRSCTSCMLLELQDAHLICRAATQDVRVPQMITMALLHLFLSPQTPVSC
jgi:hypothetical protein